MLSMVLPGRAFATAWLNAWLSTAEDAARPVLHRTLLVEVFDSPASLQMVATDSYTLLGSSVLTDPDDEHPPLEQVPAESIIVMDHDGRAPTLLRWLLADCKAAAKAKIDEPTVHVQIRSAESADAPTLDPEMDRREFVITTDRERITLDVFDSEYPAWREVILGHRPAPTDEVALSPWLLARLGKLRDADTHPLRFRLGGPHGMALLDLASDPPVFGGIMPVRVGIEPPGPDGDGGLDDLKVTLTHTRPDGTTESVETTTGRIKQLSEDLGGDAA